MKKFKIILLCSLLSLGFLGCATANNKNISLKIPVEEETILIDEKNNEELQLVEKIIDNNLSNYKDNVGIYYYNLTNKTEYKLNADRKFMGASMRKLPIVMSIADDIHSNKLTFDDKLIYNPETDKAGGSGILQGRKEIKPISIKEAMNLSMKYSDNIPHKMLLRTASKDIAAYVSYISEEIMEDPYLSAKQMASLYKRLYENPESNPVYEYILDLLKNTDYHDRIDKYLPYEKVAHKIGDYYRFYHDSAVIYSDNPYILVVMTKDVGPLRPGGDEDTRLLADEGDEACELIAKLAKDLNEELEKFHSSYNL